MTENFIPECKAGLSSLVLRWYEVWSAQGCLHKWGKSAACITSPFSSKWPCAWWAVMHVQLLPKISSGRRLLILLFALQLRHAARMPQAKETGRLAMHLGSGISPKWLLSSKVKRECSLITCSHKSGTTGHALSQQSLQHCMHQSTALHAPKLCCLRELTSCNQSQLQKTAARIFAFANASDR